MIDKPKPISIKSRKQKARNLQNSVRDDIRRLFHLNEMDVRATPMGVKGPDLQLSSIAKRSFNFAVECKAANALSIWEALEQAEVHAKLDPTHPVPLLVFKRDRSETYVAIKWEAFIAMYINHGRVR